MSQRHTVPPPFKIPTKKIFKSCLCKDALLDSLHHNFGETTDSRKAPLIPMADILMSGYSIFDLKDPSLRAFDNRRQTDLANLKEVYGIGHVPCDTQMRTVADRVNCYVSR